MSMAILGVWENSSLSAGTMSCGGAGGATRESCGGAYSSGPLHPGLRFIRKITRAQSTNFKINQKTFISKNYNQNIIIVNMTTILPINP